MLKYFKVTIPSVSLLSNLGLQPALFAQAKKLNNHHKLLIIGGVISATVLSFGGRYLYAKSKQTDVKPSLTPPDQAALASIIKDPTIEEINPQTPKDSKQVILYLDGFIDLSLLVGGQNVDALKQANNNISIIAYSYGTTLATHLAQYGKVNTILLASPFSTLAQLEKEYETWDLAGLFLQNSCYNQASDVSRHLANNLTNLQKVSAPTRILLSYDESDPFIPETHASNIINQCRTNPNLRFQLFSYDHHSHSKSLKPPAAISAFIQQV